MQKTLLVILLLAFGACKSKQSAVNKENEKTQETEIKIYDLGKEEIVIVPEKKSLSLGINNFLAHHLESLKDKRLALVVNHSSLVYHAGGQTHLVDTLLSLKLKIQKVFAPEHGFRGYADAGETNKNDTDTKTGLPIISLYGKNKKPTAQQLADVDAVIFDIQDVGVRFFTYISTMHYVMEACAESKKTCYVLDRPNPNGDYVAGSVLQKGFESFIGMHPIPIVHGLTVGELAQMINSEKWLAGGLQCDLVVVKMENYTHKTPYILPVKPSPNLPNYTSVLWYPSLCMFEGTPMSVGRGTDFP
ncbi:MAG: exo-beta-N-acetylmuramidase NamZ domain-containing protein, partial [Raineya sp.]